jgi:hypothetical protein
MRAWVPTRQTLSNALRAKRRGLGTSRQLLQLVLVDSLSAPRLLAALDSALGAATVAAAAVPAV